MTASCIMGMSIKTLRDEAGRPRLQRAPINRDYTKITKLITSHHLTELSMDGRTIRRKSGNHITIQSLGSIGSRQDASWRKRHWGGSCLRLSASSQPPTGVVLAKQPNQCTKSHFSAHIGHTKKILPRYLSDSVCPSQAS